jgi:hypothetical protein
MSKYSATDVQTPSRCARLKIAALESQILREFEAAASVSALQSPAVVDKPICCLVN